jgi:ER-bound oxygenase mpaB/B'/Rubber oxygenase, catalytic domain
MSLRLVPPLPAGTPGDPGLTCPGSVTWRVCRERVVPLGGLSALLLQLAHPLAAAGVTGHSSFQDDPTRRLMLTLEMLLVTTFGDVRRVGEMTRRLARGRLRFWGHYRVAVVRCRPAVGPNPARPSADVGSGDGNRAAAPDPGR